MAKRTRIVLAALGALVLAGCDRIAPQEAPSGPPPDLEAPAAEADPSRGFAAANEAAEAATGALTASLTMQMPDADAADHGAGPREILTLRGANGLIVEAELSDEASPAVRVDGQTLRALLELPVQVSQTLVYRVSSETKPETGRGLCGAGDAAFLVMWEPETPGATGMKLMGVSGAAPGASGATACPMLAYSRT